MLTQEDLQAIGALIREEVKAEVKPLSEKIETLDQKIETLHAFNQKAHAEIMDVLVDSNEVNGQEVKDLKKRVKRLEEHAGLTKHS